MQLENLETLRQPFDHRHDWSRIAWLRSLRRNEPRVNYRNKQKSFRQIFAHIAKNFPSKSREWFVQLNWLNVDHLLVFGWAFKRLSLYVPKSSPLRNQQLEQQVFDDRHRCWGELTWTIANNSSLAQPAIKPNQLRPISILIRNGFAVNNR